jgi:hypothetical protein
MPGKNIAEYVGEFCEIKMDSETLMEQAQGSIPLSRSPAPAHGAGTGDAH